MKPQTPQNLRTRKAPRVGVMSVLLALFGLGNIPAVVHAETLDGHWEVSVPVYLSASTFHFSSGGASDSFETVAASASIDFSSSLGAWSGSVFVDHHFSSDSRVDRMLNLGGSLKYRFGNWDATGFLVRNKLPDKSELWLYGSRFRYRLTQEHKLGVKVVSSFRHPEASIAMIVYDGEINSALSVKFAVGANIHASRKRIARAELVWQLH